MQSTVQSTNGPMTEPRLEAIDRVRSALNGALRGKAEVVEHVLACLLARGHLLSRTCRAWARRRWPRPWRRRVGGKFARVQCTPDLLPGDITGFRVFDQNTREFEFLPGPVFADVLLADEINRTTPRTQSALLEAMAERQVTVDNVRHVLSDTFFVIATQNPVEQHGTYPAARGAARPVRDEAADRLPGPRPRAGDARGGRRPTGTDDDGPMPPCWTRASSGRSRTAWRGSPSARRSASTSSPWPTPPGRTGRSRSA